MLEILANGNDYGINALKLKLLQEDQNIKFITRGSLLGQEMNLQNTTKAAQARLNKRKGRWVIKQIIFTDKQ